MKEEWAFQVRIPTISWRKLLTRQIALVLVCVAAMTGAYLYWSRQVRPFLRLDHAVLSASTTQLYANETGRIAGKIWEAGDQFHKDDPLFSVMQEKSTAMLKDFELRIKACEETRDREKENLEEAMQKYVQLQTDGVPAEIVEKVLVEVQEAQQKMLQAEEDCSVLGAEKLALQNSRNQQVVTAPFDGMILQCSKRLGEVAASGETVLSLLNPQALWLESEIPETQLSVVQVGTPATVTFRSFPGKEWSAHVSRISPVVDKGRIKIRLTGENFPVKPGLTAQLSLRVR